MKQSRSLLGLGLVFVALVVLVIVQSEQPTPNISAGSTAAAAQRVFTGWTATDVLALKWWSPLRENEITLNRNNDGSWRVSGSTQPVDENFASASLATVARLPYNQIIEGVDAERYEEYGLTEEGVELVIQIILLDGRTHAVLVGGATPLAGAGFYALVDDKPEIYVIPAEPVAFLMYYLDKFE